MSKVINVLATLANNPSLTTKQEITALLEYAEISTEQKQAILAQDSERLAETIANFPLSMCAIVLPAEDEEQESQEESQSEEAKNTLRFIVKA
ncbi:hypothetical protein CXF85_11720 [Colwellia sp. 75C3]|uniref:hypothetical protein n=1 Tax=Colwellia sp. 75C3 TaxID=888425 RepID=UPI000C326018|nr:hypothetical protein [Colwellia sp. 75C3]PKG83194.1 hypothetical protein CXF85_11720 [Colwellia sp. 75C3]